MTAPRTPRRATRRRRATGLAIISFAVLTLVSLSFLLPLVLVMVTSFTDNRAILEHGYSLFPQKWSLEAYRWLLRDPQNLLTSYGVTIVVSILGTFLSVMVTAMLAYSLSRREFTPRRWLAVLVLIPMLFTSGLVPWFILITKYLQMQDTIWVLILPSVMNVFNTLILRSFFLQLPDEILEAARIDGAGELRIFWQFAIPLSLPAIMTVSTFVFLSYWNDWWLGLLFINEPALTPVQLFLYRILTNVGVMASNPQLHDSTTVVPIQSLRMAVAVLAIGPVIGMFFAVQKYFARGIALGGVRE